MQRNLNGIRGVAAALALAAALPAAQAGIVLDFITASRISNTVSPGRASGSVLPMTPRLKLSASIKGLDNQSLSFRVIDSDDEDEIADTLQFRLFDGTSIDPIGEVDYGIVLVEMDGGLYLTFPLQSSTGVMPPIGDFFPFLPNPEQLIIPADDGLAFAVPGGSLGLSLEELPITSELVFASGFEADESVPGAKGNGSLLPVTVSGEPALFVDTNGNAMPEPSMDDLITVSYDDGSNFLIIDRDGDATIYQITFFREAFFLQIDEVPQYPLEGTPEVTNSRTEGMISLFFDNVFPTD